MVQAQEERVRAKAEQKRRLEEAKVRAVFLRLSDRLSLHRD